MAHGAGQHAALDIAALARQIFRRVAVTDALDVLVDDRALIEVARDVMRGGADQFDAALMRLVVGPRALEPWQERVVNVDAAPRQLWRYLIREYLHVTRQHHEIGSTVLNQFQDSLFLLALGLLRDRQMVERNLAEIEIAIGLARMVGDDRGRDHLEFTG